jgi:hypothetical protein
MTGNTTMKGEKIYEMELDLAGVTDYGLSMEAILSGQKAIPLHGARFDLAVNGPFKGRLAGRAHGVDYVQVRSDGRMELDLHLIIETDDGHRIAMSGDGQAAPVSRCWTSSQTSASPRPQKSMRGSTSGRSGVSGPPASQRGRSSPKASCSESDLE